MYLGLAVALFAVKELNRAWERFLIGLSAGMLVYLFFDVMHKAVELTGGRDILSWAIFLASLCVGFVGLVAFEERQQRRNGQVSSPLFLSYMIALGMGLHNLGEGLAIGASYAQGQWALSSLLVGGFALHSGGRRVRDYEDGGPDSAQLEKILGLLAGEPPCAGTVISGYGVSPYLSIIFYTLAAGALGIGLIYTTGRF